MEGCQLEMYLLILCSTKCIIYKLLLKLLFFLTQNIIENLKVTCKFLQEKETRPPVLHLPEITIDGSLNSNISSSIAANVNIGDDMCSLPHASKYSKHFTCINLFTLHHNLMV